MRTKLLDGLADVGANMPSLDIEYDSILAKETHQIIVNEKWPSLEQARKEMLLPYFSPDEDWWGNAIIDD
ncbi:hypothetical protein [Maribacter arenosus]|uniref:Uncharacterized protein n=1 Tax=Maribacter arenosus TaxID=1854708 RepID=A0ABR7VEX2_9FLAO|nr:hypothetical protein [Maribacter arenosus]MBD0852174.1 hypothetical protein [Maribacter arenosus]